MNIKLFQRKHEKNKIAVLSQKLNWLLSQLYSNIREALASIAKSVKRLKVQSENSFLTNFDSLMAFCYSTN